MALAATTFVSQAQADDHRQPQFRAPATITAPAVTVGVDIIVNG